MMIMISLITTMTTILTIISILIMMTTQGIWRRRIKEGCKARGCSGFQNTSSLLHFSFFSCFLVLYFGFPCIFVIEARGRLGFKKLRQTCLIFSYFCHTSFPLLNQSMHLTNNFIAENDRQTEVNGPQQRSGTGK